MLPVAVAESDFKHGLFFASAPNRKGQIQCDEDEPGQIAPCYDQADDCERSPNR